jgi:hypothetical protein
MLSPSPGSAPPVGTASATQACDNSENPLHQLSQFTLDNSGHGLKMINYLLNNITFVAVVLHGSNKLHGITDKSLKKRGRWYEPNKYSGIWPGIYSHKLVARRHLMDTGLSLSCAWDSFDAFAKYASDTGSISSGMAAGLTEAVNQFGFNFFYAEPIIFGTMDRTMKLLARLFPRSNLRQINRELAGELPKKLVKNGIPVSYRLTRSFVGGTAGLLVINGIIAGFSKWVTPLVTQYFGPIIDWFYRSQVPAWQNIQHHRQQHHGTPPAGLPQNPPVFA